MKYEFGISANFEGDGVVVPALDAIKAAGFTNVTIGQRKNNDFEGCLKHALEIGLKVPFVHLEFARANCLWCTGVTHDNYINELISGIETCGKHGIKVAVIHATAGEAITTAVKPSAHALDAMKKVLAVAEQQGVKIAVENTDSLNTEHLYYLLDNIKSPWLGFCYDCGHHFLYSPKTEFLKKYGKRCIAVHLHDNMMDWKYGVDVTRDLHALPFDGKIDFKRVAKDIAKSGYSSIAMLEVYRVSWGLPRLYENANPNDFLKLAYERGEKLVKLMK